MRTIRPIEELREASEHLHYEIMMFQTITNGIAIGIAGNSVIGNALLESFTIHVRGLIQFFYPERARLTDIIAEDYFDADTSWQNIRPAKSTILERAEKRAHKEVAHLTYDRLKVDAESKPWNVGEIGEEIQSLFEIFYESVDKNKLGPSWGRIRTIPRETNSTH